MATSATQVLRIVARIHMHPPVPWSGPSRDLADSLPHKPPCAPFCVALDNPSKANNIGTTIRCAVAFGASKLLLVGQRRYSVHGAHGSDRHIQGRTQVYMTWQQLAEAVVSEGYNIVGVVPAVLGGVPSTAVHLRPFQGPTVFILPHKGFQLSEAQVSVCHSFVHVGVCPALPSAHVALAADVSLSIALHHFTAWAGYTPNSFSGMKYDMEERQLPGLVDDEERERLRLERQKKRDACDIMSLDAEAEGAEEQEDTDAIIQW